MPHLLRHRLQADTFHKYLTSSPLSHTLCKAAQIALGHDKAPALASSQQATLMLKLKWMLCS